MQHFPLDTEGAVRLTALKSLENISIFGSRLPVAFELLNVIVVSHVPPANLSTMVTRESDYLHHDCDFATYHLGKSEYKNPFVRDMAIDNACRFSSILDVYRANINKLAKKKKCKAKYGPYVNMDYELLWGVCFPDFPYDEEKLKRGLRFEDCIPFFELFGVGVYECVACVVYTPRLSEHVGCCC